MAVNGNGSSLDIVYLANGSERERHQNGTCWNGNGELRTGTGTAVNGNGTRTGLVGTGTA